MLTEKNTRRDWEVAGERQSGGLGKGDRRDWWRRGSVEKWLGGGGIYWIFYLSALFLCLLLLLHLFGDPTLASGLPFLSAFLGGGEFLLFFARPPNTNAINLVHIQCYQLCRNLFGQGQETRERVEYNLSSTNGVPHLFKQRFHFSFLALPFVLKWINL